MIYLHLGHIEFNVRDIRESADPDRFKLEVACYEHDDLYDGRLP